LFDEKQTSTEENCADDEHHDSLESQCERIGNHFYLLREPQIVGSAFPARGDIAGQPLQLSRKSAKTIDSLGKDGYSMNKV
jgi:hypothetical protein